LQCRTESAIRPVTSLCNSNGTEITNSLFTVIHYSPFFSRKLESLLRDYSTLSRDYSALLRDYSALLRDNSTFSRDCAALSREYASLLKDDAVRAQRSQFHRDYLRVPLKEI